MLENLGYSQDHPNLTASLTFVISVFPKHHSDHERQTYTTGIIKPQPSQSAHRNAIQRKSYWPQFNLGVGFQTAG